MLGAALDATQPEMSKLEALRTHKRGLMQKLLTGERLLDDRFDVDAPEFLLALAGGAA